VLKNQALATSLTRGRSFSKTSNAFIEDKFYSSLVFFKVQKGSGKIDTHGRGKRRKVHVVIKTNL
jgi:hypothetical protein